MRHGDRPAALDLIDELWDDAPVAREDVTESNGRADDAALTHALHEQLGDPLARAHDAKGIDRLVRRNQDEPLDPEVLGGFHQDPRAADVVLDGLARVRL